VVCEALARFSEDVTSVNAEKSFVENMWWNVDSW